MGSLSSRPKVPAVQTVYYEPAPVSSGSGGNTTPTTETDEGGQETQKSNLLERSRGRLSTIKTSFRGLLSLADAAPKKKTLLGE